MIEALLESGSTATAAGGAVVCHPHPLYGGTMHTKAVFRAAKAALEAGFVCLRFNFRGVGQSAGTHDGGRGERDDARAALDYLLSRFPGIEATMMGFSFGAWVGLAVGAVDPRVDALVGLGLPVGSSGFGFLQGVTKPKLFVQGTDDIYGPRAKLQTLFDALTPPKSLHWVEGADHFFTERLDEVQPVIRDFLRGLPPRR